MVHAIGALRLLRAHGLRRDAAVERRFALSQRVAADLQRARVPDRAAGRAGHRAAAAAAAVEARSTAADVPATAAAAYTAPGLGATAAQALRGGGDQRLIASRAPVRCQAVRALAGADRVQVCRNARGLGDL